ncbi:MAG: hypothetical protein UX30_C0020G0009 [Candidatus Saccharibacteria bacterium GW2011_GWA2_46_10]|nr:MAG: hypothetical protein UX30_C0020G0009 [Candidatus Saccharibacteria bacterium GW2011_GWA2_46_10]
MNTEKPNIHIYINTKVRTKIVRTFFIFISASYLLGIVPTYFITHHRRVHETILETLFRVGCR